MAEFEDIKKLDPNNRVKKLKELIEQSNKDIEEAQKLAKQAEKETEEITALQEKIKVPELEDVEISDLFEKEGENLEQTVKAEAPKAEEEEQKGIYQLSPSLPTSQIYSDVMSIYNSAIQQGDVTADMAGQAGAVQYAMGKKQEDINEGAYSSTEEIERQANAIKTMTEKILSMYTGSTKKFKSRY